MSHPYLRAALGALGLAALACAPPPWLVWRTRVVPPLPAPPGPLAGRLIVLDPGHGGEWSGAVSAGGRREADVNLQVALRLEQRLQAAGATVVLTRYEDRDLVPAGQPRSLSIDLAERYRLANRYHADLFVSLHHNANPSRGDGYNATETFYKLDDDRCSRDAARYIHGYLVHHLAIPNQMVLPGNFSVLRNTIPPAVLGEALYVSHREADSLLADEAYLAREAAGYHRGIVDYFRQGVPAVTGLRWDDSTALRPTLIAGLFCDSLSGSLDPDAIELEVDGRAVETQYRADRAEIRWPADADLANGPHAVRLTVRNIHGNSSPAARASLRVDRPAAVLTLAAVPPRVAADSAAVVQTAFLK